MRTDPTRQTTDPEETAEHFRLGPGCHFDPAGQDSVCDCPVAHPRLAAITERLWRLPVVWRLLLSDRVMDRVTGLPCWLQDSGSRPGPDEMVSRRPAHRRDLRRLPRSRERG